MNKSTLVRPVNLKKFITEVEDFPKPGIQFKDITPLLKAPKILNQSVEMLIEPFLKKEVTAVAGMEARGFIFGALAAHKLNTSFIPLRKPDKLPYDVKQTSYDLEYGSASLEIHTDAAGANDNVLLVDDLIATGGTAEAAAKLVKMSGGQVAGFIFVINLFDLGGKKLLEDKGYKSHSLMDFPGH